jgi:hypothetical protein
MVVAYSKNYPDICLEGPRKTEIASVRITGILAEI